MDLGSGGRGAWSADRVEGLEGGGSVPHQAGEGCGLSEGAEAGVLNRDSFGVGGDLLHHLNGRCCLVRLDVGRRSGGCA